MTKINLIVVLLAYACLLTLIYQPNLVLGSILVLLSIPALIALYVFLYRTFHDFLEHINPTSLFTLAACQLSKFCLLTPIVITFVYNLRIIAYLVDAVAHVDLAPLHHF